MIEVFAELAPGPSVVDGAADEVLADSALAEKQDRRVGVGDVLDDTPDGPHRRAVFERECRFSAHAREASGST